jgi:integrase
MSARRRFGAVRKLPSGRWQARYWVAAGERIGAPQTFATKGDAQRWLSAAETDMHRGLWYDPRLGDITFGEWQAKWLTSKTPTLQPSTVELYRYLLRRHVVPRFGGIAIGRISTLDVQEWLSDLHEGSLSPNSVAKAYRVLKGVLTGAVDAGLITRSPCTIKGASTERIPEMSIATPDQVADIARAAGPQWGTLVLVAAYSGLRWGELAGLRRMDVDIERSTITVVRKLAEVNGVLSFGPPKTSAGRRTVGIPGFVSRELAQHINQFAESTPQGLVFPAPEGGPLRRSNFRRRVWAPATEAANVPGLRFHDLRHTAATMAAASGTTLKALMARIGHASVAAALRYQHVTDGQDEAIVRFLEGLAPRPSVPNSNPQSPPVPRA